MYTTDYHYETEIDGFFRLIDDRTNEEVFMAHASLLDLTDDDSILCSLMHRYEASVY